jgi:Acetyltransferase (GNAT) domain
MADTSQTGFRVALIETPDQRRQWDRFVRGAPAGSLNQCFWWADPLEQHGVTARGIACWDGEVQVGGAMLRSLPVPLAGGTITECLQGPLFVDWRPEWAAPVLAGIEEIARRSRSIGVSLQACPRRDVAEDLASAMRRAGMKLTRAPGGREAILALAGRSLDDVIAGFHKGTRRAIKKGQQGPVEVRRVAGTDELRRAHGTWLATAARKGFASVRPWETAEPMLRHSIDAGLGAVLAGFVGEELLAAVFVTYIGTAASYIYGGFADDAERHRPNHVLHLEAIKVALAGGYATYNLGTLSIDGVDQFKLGFGAVPVPRTDTVVWERRAALYGVMQRLRRQRVGPALETLVRRRLAGRAR